MFLAVPPRDAIGALHALNQHLEKLIYKGFTVTSIFVEMLR